MKKKIVIIIITLLIISVIFAGIRYFRYRELLGEWVMTNDTENYGNDLYSPYTFNYFGKFTMGNIENKKVSLWGTTGYYDGTYKIVKKDGRKTIEMKLLTGSYSVYYEIMQEEDNTYLITTERSTDKQQTKYQKK